MKNACGEAWAVLDARSEVEVELGTLKENHAKMAEQLKEVVRARDSAEAGLKTIEKQLVTDLHEELRKAREAAQLFKEAAEAEKQAVYALGMEETQARLIEEFSAIARDYYDIFWGKTFNVAEVPADSGLK